MLENYLALDTTAKAMVIENIFRNQMKSMSIVNVITLVTEFNKYNYPIQDLVFEIEVIPIKEYNNIEYFELKLSGFNQYRQNHSNNRQLIEIFFDYLYQDLDNLHPHTNETEIEILINFCYLNEFHKILESIFSFKNPVVRKPASNQKWYFENFDGLLLDYQLSRIISYYEICGFNNMSHELKVYNDVLEFRIVYVENGCYQIQIEFRYLEDAFHLDSLINKKMDIFLEPQPNRSIIAKVNVSSCNIQECVECIISII